ncbi:MAG: hypothetical protein AOA65_0010 [Candidatus Bathyarchaeota archaeon BA1]|nr:MAG: hypothetical protein AOA65_0010 [Candidatus Bathyarchaeota archaeon BA1]
MSVQPKLRVHLECGDARVDFEGDADEVFKAFTEFLNKIYPSFEVARKLIFIPDIIGLSEEIAGLIEIAPEGPMLVLGRELPADETICLALLGSDIGNRLGKLSKASLSLDELAKVTGKAHKTIMNQLPWMIDEGLIERVGKGEYRITSLGIKRAQNVIKDYKASRK